MAGRALMLAAVVAQTLAGFLPWIRTGQRERSGFELVDAARSLDVLDTGLQRGLATAWYLVPLAAALCWVAVLVDWRRTGAVLALATGALGLVYAASIERTAVPSLLGVHVTLMAALAVIAGGALVLLERRTI